MSSQGFIPGEVDPHLLAELHDRTGAAAVDNFSPSDVVSFSDRAFLTVAALSAFVGSIYVVHINSNQENSVDDPVRVHIPISEFEQPQLTLLPNPPIPPTNGG